MTKIVNTISVSSIYNIYGLTTNTVKRLFKHFKNEGVIKGSVYKKNRGAFLDANDLDIILEKTKNYVFIPDLLRKVMHKKSIILYFLPKCFEKYDNVNIWRHINYFFVQGDRLDSMQIDIEEQIGYTPKIDGDKLIFDVNAISIKSYKIILYKLFEDNNIDYIVISDFTNRRIYHKRVVGIIEKNLNIRLKEKGNGERYKVIKSFCIRD